MTKEEKDAIAFLANARGYQLVTAILNDLTGSARKLVHYQLLTTEVFALELSIKACLRLRGITQKGHDIEVLYQLLPQPDKDAIKKHYDQMIADHPSREWAIGLGIELEIDSVLKNNRDLFRNARYWSEGRFASAPDKGTDSNAGITIISEAIRKVILSEYPDWTDDNLADKFRPDLKNL